MQESKDDTLFKGCQFHNNTSMQGGALYIYDSDKDVSIKNCLFLGNYAQKEGGSLFIYNYGIFLNISIGKN